MKIEEILAYFSQLVIDPFDRWREYKERFNKRIIGFFLTDFPEEIIHAADMLPVAVLGTRDNISLADAHLQPFACSLVRGTLENKLNHRLDLLDGMVIPHICDSTQCLASIWRASFGGEYFDDLVFPKNRSTPGASQYLINELLRFKQGLEEYFRIKISEERLWQSIELYNKNRAQLRQLYELKRHSPQVLSEQEFFDIIAASMLMPKEEHDRLLGELLKGLPSRRVKAEKGVRLVLSGMILEPRQALQLLDELGAIIVDDDLCLGHRYFAEDIRQNGDPIRALAERHFRLPPFPGYHHGGEELAESLINRIRNRGAQGLIFWHLKFCEVYNFDYPDLKRRLEERGIPHLLVETELQMTSLEQIRTRLQAFIEMLGRDRS